MMLVAAVFLLTTAVSASLVENKVRMDFYQAMQKATAHDHSRQQDLKQRLLRLARPRVLEQGDDAVANGDDQYINNGDDQYVNNGGIDLREYAFKYVVSSISMYAQPRPPHSIGVLISHSCMLIHSFLGMSNN